MLGFPRIAGVEVAGPGLPVVMMNCWSLPNWAPVEWAGQWVLQRWRGWMTAIKSGFEPYPGRMQCGPRTRSGLRMAALGIVCEVEHECCIRRPVEDQLGTGSSRIAVVPVKTAKGTSNSLAERPAEGARKGGRGVKLFFFGLSVGC